MTLPWERTPDDLSVLASPARDAKSPRGLISRRGGVRLRPGSEPAFRANKPVWLLADVGDAIAAFERHGAAVGEGQIYRVAGGQAAPIPRPGGPIDLLAGPGTWHCKRNPSEAWAAYVARAAGVARAELAGLVLGIEDAGDDSVYVDLGWETEDELSLFDLPGFLREAVERVLAARHEPRRLLNVAAFAVRLRVRF